MRRAVRSVGRGARALAGLPVRGTRAVTTWYRTRPRTATRVLAVAAVALVAVAVTFSVLQVRATQAATARDEALAVAKEAVPNLLSYDHRSIKNDLDARLGQVGGRFKDDYQGLVRDIVIPASDRDQLVTQTSVAAAGVGEPASSDRVRLTMFLNQTSTRAGQQQPTLSGSRVLVTMERDGDRWLVTALDPV